MKDGTFHELTALCFSMRQIIRAKLPHKNGDPNAWLWFETLRFVDEEDEPTMREIARHLRITAPSASSLVAHLESKNLLKRSKVGKDKRVVRAHLTKKGSAELSAYHKRSVKTMRKVFTRIPERDVRELVRVLRALSHAHPA